MNCATKVLPLPSISRAVNWILLTLCFLAPAFEAVANELTIVEAGAQGG